jgi:hypothetical protein
MVITVGMPFGSSLSLGSLDGPIAHDASSSKRIVPNVMFGKFESARRPEMLTEVNHNLAAVI